MSPIGEKPAATGFGVAGAPSRKSWMPAADHVAATWCQPDATVQSVTAAQVVGVAGGARVVNQHEPRGESAGAVQFKRHNPPRATHHDYYDATPPDTSRCGL